MLSNYFWWPCAPNVRQESVAVCGVLRRKRKTKSQPLNCCKGIFTGILNGFTGFKVDLAKNLGTERTGVGPEIEVAGREVILHDDGGAGIPIFQPHGMGAKTLPAINEGRSGVCRDVKGVGSQCLAANG